MSLCLRVTLLWPNIRSYGLDQLLLLVGTKHQRKIVVIAIEYMVIKEHKNYAE